MHIEVFNEKLLKRYSDIDIRDLGISLEKLFEQDININVVFVKEKEIKRLNREYRKKNFVTDVLSFNLDNIGEIYICPKFVGRTFKKNNLREEILRLCIHGILHLLGYEHKGKFEEGNTEEIFEIQEDKLKKLLRYMDENLYLIAGLGNPGTEYENNIHNTGYMFLDRFEEFLKEKDFIISGWKNEKIFDSEVNILKKDNTKIVFLKPQVFMNNSGISIKKVLKKYKIDDFSKQLILVHDDLDIPLGQYKIQLEKSPRGHNGVKSIEDHLGRKDFLRVRIGVDNRNGRDIPGEKYVLMNFTEDEKVSLFEAIDSAFKELFLYLN